MIAAAVAHLTKHLGASLILDGISIEIPDDARFGLVGPNGAGKSTLLKVLAGIKPPDAGSVTYRKGLSVAYVPQEPEFTEGSTLLGEVLGSNKALQKLESKMADLQREMEDPEVYGDAANLERKLAEHERVLNTFEEKGGLSFRGRAEGSLRELGFSPDNFDTPVDLLSGGQKKLLAIARALATKPDLLLLDEPDNHLDLEGKATLERIIAAFDGAVVVISHDRYLLDIVIDTIVELEITGQHPGRPQLSVFHGNYSEYAVEKHLALEKQQHDFRLQQREVKRLEQSIHRLMDWARVHQNHKFVRRAQSMQKRLDKMDRVERPILEPKRMGLELSAERGSRKVLELRGLWKAFGETTVLNGIDLLIWHGERVGLVGPNGAGKTVLFRTILGQESPTEGEVVQGPSITASYYSQEHESLDPDATPVEEVRALKPMLEASAYAFLGRFLIDYHMARRKVATLSGGEKSRLQMAKITLGKSNFLLLDEPTNNLDIPSAEVLEEALQDFTGTVFVISHDRYFLDRIVDRIVELEDGTIMEHAGNYSRYVEEKKKVGSR